MRAVEPAQGLEFLCSHSTRRCYVWFGGVLLSEGSDDVRLVGRGSNAPELGTVDRRLRRRCSTRRPYHPRRGHSARICSCTSRSPATSARHKRGVRFLVSERRVGRAQGWESGSEECSAIRLAALPPRVRKIQPRDLGEKSVWPRLGISEVDETTVGDWLMANTNRDHFFLSGSQLTHLLEAFLQCRLSPVFEG